MSARFEPRAARIAAPGNFRIERFEPEDPAPGQVRVRLQGCGVCASNLPVWEGRPWFSYPLQRGAPGHEGWGIVDAVGCEVKDVAVGERVAFLSGHAYAEYDFTQPDSLVRLPSELDREPFPGEALGCAVNIFRRSGIEAGQNVAILGVGFLGAAVTALAVRAGARVVALSRRTFARRLAEQLGATAAFGLDEAGAALGCVRNSDATARFDRVIECIGSQEALTLATELCGTRARLVIGGYHQDGERRVNMQQWNWLGLDVINAHERDPAEYVRGMREAVGHVLRGSLNLGTLLTHQFPLEEMSDAFDALTRRPDGFLKAVVRFQ
jgi:threonine dehydrogenase-like Zn-dependent dehydrogenase